MSVFKEVLAEKGVLLADGATGTNLFEMGLAAGEAPERWIIDHPDRIQALHKSFTDAGSDLFLTNTFGGTAYRLALHGLDKDVHGINHAAAKLARQVADSAGRPIVVAGSVGPTGELIEPLGKISFDDAKNAFAKQIQGLVEGGVDVIWVETISAPEELRAAIEAAADYDIPMCATMSFDMEGRTMMGLSPTSMVQISIENGLDGCGANCGVGVSDLMGSILTMRNAMAGQETPQTLIAKANCGIPRFEGDKIVYDGTEDVMATFALLARAAGAKIIGGCCGTTPKHIRAMREALDDPNASHNLEILAVNSLLGEMSGGAKSLAQGNQARASRTRKRARQPL